MALPSVDALSTGIARADRVLIVLAGPNGAGKSTFFDAFLAPTGVQFVNADLIARALALDNPSAIAYEAADTAAEERRRLLAEGVSFCMETVFSDPVGDKLRFLQDAQAAGYTVFLNHIYFETRSFSSSGSR